MIGVDTNILLRIMILDDLDMADRGEAALLRCRDNLELIHVNLVVIAELVWMLRQGYRYGRHEIADAIEPLLTTDVLDVAESEVVWAVVREFGRSTFEFPDLLIAELNRRRGCTTTLTFDCKAARHPAFEAI